MKGRITINAKDTKKKQTYGNGSIYFVESRQRFAGQVYLTIDGEKERRTVYGKTKKIVKDKMRELQIQALSSNLEKRNRNKVEIKTIHQLAEKMIEEQLALNEIRQSTYDRKMETLKMLSDISDKQLTEVTEDDIVGFFKVKLDYSQSSINKMYQLLGAVFVKAISKKLIESNPLSDIKCPKSRKKQIPVRALTVDEQIRLLNVLKTEDIHYGDIMLLSMFTGMRIGECCALTAEDINLTDKTINVSKTVSRGEFGNTVINDTKTAAGMRTLFISDDVADFLKECLGGRKRGLLFTSSNGRLVTSNQVNYVYSNVIKNYDILDSSVYGRVDLHSLRHTYATRCIESGMPAKVLQKLLGHTDINITLNVYCSVFEKFKNEHLAIADEYMKSNNLQIA